jgi:hypothetical protein
MGHLRVGFLVLFESVAVHTKHSYYRDCRAITSILVCTYFEMYVLSWGLLLTGYYEIHSIYDYLDSIRVSFQWKTFVLCLQIYKTVRLVLLYIGRLKPEGVWKHSYCKQANSSNQTQKMS